MKVNWVLSHLLIGQLSRIVRVCDDCMLPAGSFYQTPDDIAAILTKYGVREENQQALLNELTPLLESRDQAGQDDAASEHAVNLLEKSKQNYFS